MIKIGLVVPHSNFIENALGIFDDHNNADTIYNEEEYVMEEIIVSMEQLRQINICVDVIITRGLYAQILKKYQKDTPIIELSLKATDLIQTLSECKKKYGNCKVGIIAAKNMIAGAENIPNLIDLPSKMYIIEQLGSEEELINQAVMEKCEVIIGGLTTCRLAHKMGLKNVLIKTCKESLWQCITEAKRAAQISINEQEKSKLINIILNSSKEGILSINVHNRIDIFNKGAEKILKISNSKLKELGLQDAPFPIELKKIFLDEKEYSNEIVKYNNSMLSINKTFIKVNDSIVSTVITLQEMSNIQDIEFKMRKKIYSRAHIAKYTFDNIAGSSDIIKMTIEKAKKFSLTNSNILLIGKSGTGKEIFAQSIHNHSLRKEGPFVAVNCAAIPESLLESELFGYVGGAFTDARKSGKYGFFELAHKGTIFLDEIGEIPMALQSKLLRVLQEHEITRIGDDKVTPIDIRIIAATNKNLEELVCAGKFREDLLYRIDVLRLNIPTLNERREDIPELIDMFLKNNFNGIRITKQAKNIMSKHDWHGNIRQLFNICERLAVLSTTGTITTADVENELNISAPQKKHTLYLENNNLSYDDKEKALILDALAASKYNRTAAAKLLNIDRSTLWRKMKQYNI